jgi:hypothetical protein
LVGPNGENNNLPKNLTSDTTGQKECLSECRA